MLRNIYKKEMMKILSTTFDMYKKLYCIILLDIRFDKYVYERTRIFFTFLDYVFFLKFYSLSTLLRVHSQSSDTIIIKCVLQKMSSSR